MENSKNDDWSNSNLDDWNIDWNNQSFEWPTQFPEWNLEPALEWPIDFTK